MIEDPIVTIMKQGMVDVAERCLNNTLSAVNDFVGDLHRDGIEFDMDLVRSEGGKIEIRASNYRMRKTEVSQ